MYPSDISDKEWEILEPYVAQGAIGRPRKHDIRACNKIYNEREVVSGECCQKIFRHGKQYTTTISGGAIMENYNEYMTLW